MSKNRDANFYIKHLKLKELIRDDYLAEFHISPTNKFCWAYYLLKKGNVFGFHIMRSESSWQYCDGAPVELIVIEKKNTITRKIIGPDAAKGHTFVHVVEPNKWFAATSLGPEEFTLVTHCMCPPYCETEEACGYRNDIEVMIPNYPEIIDKFSCIPGFNDTYLLDPKYGYRYEK